MSSVYRLQIGGTLGLLTEFSIMSGIEITFFLSFEWSEVKVFFWNFLTSIWRSPKLMVISGQQKATFFEVLLSYTWMLIHFLHALLNISVSFYLFNPGDPEIRLRVAAGKGGRRGLVSCAINGSDEFYFFTHECWYISCMFGFIYLTLEILR